jgi:hypothetical protein
MIGKYGEKEKAVWRVWISLICGIEDVGIQKSILCPNEQG